MQTPWGELVDTATLNSLPEAEIRRQTYVFSLTYFVIIRHWRFSIISKVIMKEQQYVQDLDLIETVRHKCVLLIISIDWDLLDIHQGAPACKAADHQPN
jgi:hypothetical protein